MLVELWSEMISNRRPSRHRTMATIQYPVSAAVSELTV
jgi:hypothetical protein